MVGGKGEAHELLIAKLRAKAEKRKTTYQNNNYKMNMIKTNQNAQQIQEGSKEIACMNFKNTSM